MVRINQEHDVMMKPYFCNGDAIVKCYDSLDCGLELE